MKILLTGSNGFLGKTITDILSNDNEITTLSRKNATINVDLSEEVISNLPKLDLVIHAAGKAHIIPKTEEEKNDFFKVNAAGTKNLLTSLETSSIKSFILISTVAVYGLIEGENIDESQSLLAKDPYGLSKIEAENLVLEWCKKHNVVCSILRLPLIIGINAPGNLGAMTKGIQKGYYLNIAGGKAKKSMVLAKDIALFIPKIKDIGGVYNLTDGYHPSFYELSRYIALKTGKKIPLNIPYYLALIMAKIGDLLGEKSPINSLKLKKINSNLTFSDEKAKIKGWRPTKILESNFL